MDEKEVTEPTDKHPLEEAGRIVMGIVGTLAGGPILFFGGILLLLAGCTVCAAVSIPVRLLPSP